jgi:hypothetical protein
VLAYLPAARLRADQSEVLLSVVQNAEWLLSFLVLIKLAWLGEKRNSIIKRAWLSVYLSVHLCV